MFKYKKLIQVSFSILLLFLINTNFAYADKIEQNKIEVIIKNFLLNNPELIKSTLENYEISQEIKKKRNAIELLNISNNPRLLQKNADITIFEFFDYNCGYCKSVVKLLLDTINEDKKINLVFVEFPILSEDSYTASLAALAAGKQNLYSQFHISLMKVRGRINEKQIFKTAKEVGLDINKLKLDMENPDIQLILKTNREVAKLLKLNGTPAFIIGDVIYPGAIKKDQLKKAIKLYRKS
ncbi:DsbA family protein [Alphaproteobacteria bacterium]|nr:DsbA family protein [Alphaproteobacteria bacterium]